MVVVVLVGIPVGIDVGIAVVIVVDEVETPELLLVVDCGRL